MVVGSCTARTDIQQYSNSTRSNMADPLGKHGFVGISSFIGTVKARTCSLRATSSMKGSVRSVRLALRAPSGVGPPSSTSSSKPAVRD